MSGNSIRSIDVLLVVPKQERISVGFDNKFDNVSANFSIPYYISYLYLCRKLGIEINLSKKKVVRIPTDDGPKVLWPNENPSHTALLLATILDHNHFSFYVIDPPLGFPSAARKVLKTQLKLRPKILAISTTFVISSKDVRDIIKLARRYSPETKIMVGGQFLLTDQKSIHEMKETDVFVIGESEDNLIPLVKALIQDNTEAMKDIKGIIYRDNGKFIQAPPSAPVDLDKSLPINWNLMNDFFPPRKDIIGFVLVEDARGCVFKCSYCTYRKNFHFRVKSIDKVISEIKAVPHQPGGVNIFFASSTFTFPQERAMKIASRISEENLKYRYGAYGRVQDISKEFVEKLKAANFYWLFLGVESMDEKVLRLARKITTPNQIEKAIQLSFNAGIITDCSFIVGLPGENRESVKKIAEFLKKPYAGRYCLFPLVDMDSSDLATHPEAYNFKRGNYMNWQHPEMSSREVPRVMADLIMDANKANHSYCTTIIDILIGNQISSAPLTSVSPDDTKPFFVLIETGTVLFLGKFLRGSKIDRDQLGSIIRELKQNYLPKFSIFFRMKEFVKISVKILAFKIARFYFLKRNVGK